VLGQVSRAGSGRQMEMALTSHTPAHDVTATVAPFRAWRGSQLIIAGGPMRATIEGRHYGGFDGRMQQHRRHGQG